MGILDGNATGPRKEIYLYKLSPHKNIWGVEKKQRVHAVTRDYKIYREIIYNLGEDKKLPRKKDSRDFRAQP